MNEPEPLHGLACPRCGGMVPVPEGQEIVVCPFCDLRSVVKGERGLRRYQVPLRIGKDQAQQAFQKFLSGNLAIARDAAHSALISEVMLVHLPFWAAWGRGLGWIFGTREEGSGDDRRSVPHEERIVEELNWNGAACDVGEFGVTFISLEGRALEPFNADKLHSSGLVFEPVGSDEEALATAQSSFEARIRSKAGLDHISQAFVRIVRPRMGIVSYPVWVIRYLYHNRAFQVMVDGYSGEVLYGKAPGNVYYRAGILVGGMALGSFVSIDLAYLFAGFSNNSNNSSGTGALIAFVIGLILMYGSYRTFRYGEHYEYRRYKGPGEGGIAVPDSLRTAGKVVEVLSRF